MSYAVRNTIILLVTLALFVGATFSYIKFFQLEELEKLEEVYAEKQKDYQAKRETSDAFPQLNDTYQQAVAIINNFDKSLFPAPDPDIVYDYLDYISNKSANSRVYFDFVFVDSTAYDQYGILTADINGYGNFKNFMNFINTLENSKRLNKISGLSLSPPAGNSQEELTEVSFSFTLESYYERIPIQDNTSQMNDLILDETVSTYNIFYPLILPTVPPNEDGLINVEQSRLIGITASRIFIVDQGGNVQSLSKGDTVYLGRLSEINVNEKSATFNLNKGGITELVTLEIER